ncbi:MAG: DUF2062 domain-containing protein [Myxococcaceae bacterium]
MSTSLPRRIRARRKLRQWWRQVKNEQATPRRLGVAVGLGVLLGCSPLWGFQVLLGVTLAWVLRLNKLAVLLGLQISVPPLWPFIIVGTAQAGELVLEGRLLPLTLAEVRAAPLPDVFLGLFVDMLVGTVLVGGAAALVLGAVTSALVRKHRERKRGEPMLGDDELDALHERLDWLPGQFRSYGSWKVRLDPVYPLALDRLAGAKHVVDLGAGMGLMEALLATRLPGARIRGIEWDDRKVGIAGKLLGDLPGVAVEKGDARTAELGTPDAILLFDVLHYIAPAEQREWLSRCARALAPGGVLVIRELDSTAKKGNLAERIDRFAVRIGWNRGGGVHSWPIEEMTALLVEQGFDVQVQQAGRGIFSANALVTARKPSGASLPAGSISGPAAGAAAGERGSEGSRARA